MSLSQKCNERTAHLKVQWEESSSQICPSQGLHMFYWYYQKYYQKYKKLQKNSTEKPFCFYWLRESNKIDCW